MEFYRQGATVSSTVTINSGASATVHVYDPGRLQVSPTPDTVVAGVGGPSLTVTALGVDDDPTRITVHNGTASAVTINAGTRLIPTTSRPTAYRDPSGAVGLGSSITADGDGRATCYVDEKRFDYTVPGDPVIFDRDSSQTLTGSYDTMTWEHTAGDTDPLLAGGADRLVLVAISWQDSLAEESITSVTYGGIAMTRVALRGLVELYSLLNPPTGSQNIVVTWDGTNPKGAVSSALSLSHVDRSSPLGAPVGNNQGGSTLISVTVPETDPCGMVVDAVAVKAGSSLTTFTPGAAQVTRWYDHAGTSGDGTLIQGAGSTRAGSGGSVTMSWTLVAPKSWWAVAVQVNAAPSRLVVDAEGADLARAPIVLNAADYPTIQAAIDACPKGGAVYIPTGDWSLSVHGENGTLKVRQSLHKDGL